MKLIIRRFVILIIILKEVEKEVKEKTIEEDSDRKCNPIHSQRHLKKKNRQIKILKSIFYSFSLYIVIRPSYIHNHRRQRLRRFFPFFFFTLIKFTNEKWIDFFLNPFSILNIFVFYFKRFSFHRSRLIYINKSIFIYIVFIT